MMGNPSPRPPQLFTLVEVANQLQVSTKTLRRWITQDQLRVHRLGRQIRISAEDLQIFVTSRRT